MVNNVFEPGCPATGQSPQTSRRQPRLQKGILAAFAFTVAGFLPIALIQIQKSALRLESTQAEQWLKTDPVTGLVLAIRAVGQNRDRLPGEILPEVQSSLLTAVQTARERNRFDQKSSVDAVAFSPDTRTIAAASANGTLHLWNQQGQHRSILGNAKDIRSLSFSADGNQIISFPAAPAQGVVQRWNLKQNTVSLLQFDTPSPMTAAAFSSDDETVLSGSIDGKVRLWNQHQQWIGQLNPSHAGAVTGVAFAGGTIASSGIDGKIFLWNNKGNLLGQLSAGSSIRSMRLEQAGQRIITEDAHFHQAFLWNTQSNQWQQYVLGKTRQVRSVDLNSDNTIVAQGLDNGMLYLTPFVPQSKITGQTLLGYQGQVNTVRFSPDGKTLVSGGKDGSIRFWDVYDGTLLSRFHAQEWLQDNLKTVALSPNGQKAAISDSSGRIYLRDIQRNTIVQLGEVAPGRLVRIVFSTDSQTIAVRAEDSQSASKIYLWRSNGQALANFSIQNQNKIQALAVNSDETSSRTQIITLSKAGKLQLWNPQGQLLSEGNTTGSSSQTPAQFLRLSSDGQRLLSGATSIARSSGQVCLWSLQSRITLQTCKLISSQIAQFSPNGQIAAIGSPDGKIYLWNLQTQQMTVSPVIYPNGITAITFSPNGKTIAIGSPDGTVRLLTSEAYPIGQPYTGHPTAIQSVAFSEDGQRITSLSQDGELRLWQGNWQGWLKTACDRLQNHPAFTQPATAAAEEAKATCQRWVWSSEASSSPSPVPASAVEAAPQTVRLVVKLSDRRVYVHRGDTVETSYPVAIGQPGWETPVGQFRVFEMLKNPGWTHPLTNAVIAPGAENPLGSRWIAFWTDGYNAAGFHGTPNQASVGQAVSHGCLRMRDEDVLALYEWVRLGTPVTVEH